MLLEMLVEEELAGLMPLQSLDSLLNTDRSVLLCFCLVRFIVELLIITLGSPSFLIHELIMLTLGRRDLMLL